MSSIITNIDDVDIDDEEINKWEFRLSVSKFLCKQLICLQSFFLKDRCCLFNRLGAQIFETGSYHLYL